MNNSFFAPTNFWPYVTFGVLTVMAVVAIQRQRQSVRGWEGLAGLGRIFYVVPMGVFSAEHFTVGKGMIPMVPSYMPWRLFWVYFVGVALIAATLSIMWRVQLRLSASLLGLMFLLFVVMNDVPGALSANAPWNVKVLLVRETAFACAALLLAATDFARGGHGGAKLWIGVLSGIIAVTAILFGIEQFFHPASLPVIPLPKTIPDWMPGGNAWGYFTSVAMVVGGIGMLVPPFTRRAALWLGALAVFLIVVIYLPVMLASRDIVGLNYFTDTMVYAGVLLIAADAQLAIGS